MEPFIGEIKMVGFNYAPKGWAVCSGELLAIAQNPALFSLLGTNYGGDGVRTFGLPDLRGRVPVHQGVLPGGGGYSLGELTGSESMTLLVANLPAHGHTIPVGDNDGSATDPTNAVRAVGGSYDPTATSTNGTAIGASGGSQPFSLLQPFLCLLFVIATSGVFPSRN